MAKKRLFDREKYLAMLRQKLGTGEQVIPGTTLYAHAQGLRQTLGKGRIGGNGQ